MNAKVYTVAGLLILVSVGVLFRVWLAPGTRRTESASTELLVTSKQSMNRASRLDLALSITRKKRPAALESLQSKAATSAEREAIVALRQCVEERCDRRDELAIVVKDALVVPMKEKRKQLKLARSDGKRRELVLFLLICVGCLAVLGGYLTQRDERMGDRDFGARGGSSDEDQDAEALELAFQDRLEQIYRLRKQGRENARFAVFGEIAAGLSHGLKTPLACVRAATQVAQAKIDDDHSAQKNLDDVIDEVDGLVGQINRFLKTMGSDSLVLDKLNPVQVMESLDERYRQGIPNRQLSWEMRLPPSIGCVRGEMELIEMALRNLIDNAFEATRSGSTVTLLLGECEPPSHVGIDAVPTDEGELSWIEIAVLDEGPGVATDLLSRENIESSRDTGSGLGLAIARRIANRLGGALSLTMRADGKGTRASFILPSIDPEDSDEAFADRDIPA